MAEVPTRADLTVSVEGGTVEFSITDDERLANIDKAVYAWSPVQVGKAIGMDVENVEVER